MTTALAVDSVTAVDAAAGGDILAALGDAKTESKLRLLTRYEKEYSRQYQSAYKLLIQHLKELRAVRQALREQIIKQSQAYIDSPLPGEPGFRGFPNEPGPTTSNAPALFRS